MNPPRRWLAVLLSLLTAGLGQLYCGRVARAVAILVLVDLASAAAHWLLVAGPVGLSLLVALALASQLGFAAIAVDAYRIAGEPRGRFASRAAVVGACAGFVIGAQLVGLAAGLARARLLGTSYSIASEAMLPTLRVGDHLFSNALAYRRAEPRRGDVVALRAARDTLVKRVVGVPGDRIELRGGALFVNGERATGGDPVGEVVDAGGRHLAVYTEALGGREYRIAEAPDLAPSDFGPIVVEPGRYCVAEDNRAQAKDSRPFGIIARDQIEGPTSRIYWSSDWGDLAALLLRPADVSELLRGRVHWDRIGVATN